MNSELGSWEPLGGVGVKTDDVLPRGVGGEGELALAAVHLGQDDLVVRVPDLHVHTNLRTGGGKAISSGVVELHFVISSNLENTEMGCKKILLQENVPWSRQEFPQ